MKASAFEKHFLEFDKSLDHKPELKVINVPLCLETNQLAADDWDG